MTLRARTVIAAVVSGAVLVLVGLVVMLQYLLTASVNIALQQDLSPAVDKAALLTLEQSRASDALSDYLMLGQDTSLDAYRQAIGRATTLLDELRDGLSGEAELEDLVTRARAAQRTWVKADADPVVLLMEAGKRIRAMRETNSPEAAAAFEQMTQASNALHQELNDSRDEAAASIVGFMRLLGISLLVVGLLLVAGLLVFFTGLQRWVLAPLSHLRESIQEAVSSPGHTSPVQPDGPPEIRSVGVDAELLRRGLVREIDEAQAAREGLVQDAPLVAAIQAELRGSSPEPPRGLAVAGTSQSAEGVVAGDWWDTVTRPDGSLAVVVADVSGHGPEAAVTALRVRSVLRAGLRHGLGLADVVAMAADSCTDDAHFVTAIVLVADPQHGTLTWCNAGHHPAILVTRDKEASLCGTTGPLISVLGGDWTSQSRSLNSGDVVIAYTDGLVESRDDDGEELQTSAVTQFLRGLDAPVRENPEELIARLTAQARHRAADWRHDDLTIVALARRQPGP